MPDSGHGKVSSRSYSSAPLQPRNPNATGTSQKRKHVTTIDLTGDSDNKACEPPQRPISKAPKTLRSLNHHLPTGPASSCPPLSQSSRYHDALALGSRQHAEDDRRAWLSQPSATQEIDDVDEIIGSSQDGATDTTTHYGDLPTKIVGVQYYRGIANPGEFILMRREPGNPYDSNAIRIDNVGYTQIGHIPKRIAAKLAPYLDEGSLRMDGRLAGVVGQFDCPLEVKIYGPDPRSVEGRRLVQRMTDDKLPLKALKEAEKREKERCKREDKARQERAKAQQQALKQRLAEARLAAAAGASTATGGGGSISMSTQGFRGEAAVGDGLSSQIDIFEAGQRFSLRNMGEVPEKFGLSEECLKDMPMALKPAGIKTEMLPYQLQALAWLLDRESPKLPTHQGPEAAVQLWQKGSRGEYTNLATNFSTQTPPVLANGGILADDMGLGKTLEMISLIVADKEKTGRGSTLVVAPLSVMSNWSGQIATHVSEDSALQIYTYHSAGRVPMKPEEFAKYDVVITTYQTLASDYMPRGKGSSNKQPMKELRATGLYSMDWRRVILDEGHIVRNPQAKGCLAVTALTARSRWALTGTPIVNSLKDLYSLLRFIGVTGGLEQLEAFNSCLVRPLKAGDSSATALLHAVMTAFSLRRKKEMTFIDLRLPKLEKFIHRIDFSKKESERYQILFEQAQGMMRQYNSNANAANRAEAYNHLLTMLLRLRQCCNHWQLCGERVVDLLKQLEGSQTVELHPENVRALQDVLQVQIESQEDCAVCLELLHDPVITNCGHSFGRDCIARVIETQHKCPMCRAVLKDEACLVSPRHEGGDEEADDEMDLTQSSSKLERLMQILSFTKQAGEGEKTIVFSQWTRFLDIVQARLDRDGYKYCRLDGTMSPSKRDEALAALERDPDCTVLLASLGICAVGLNLTAANQIILSDTWWSAAVEDQAVDRVHRLGQKRLCRVFRLVMDGSIEERTLDIQQEKRKLMMLAFAEKKSKRGDAKTGRLADIQRLLGGGEKTR